MLFYSYARANLKIRLFGSYFNWQLLQNLFKPINTWLMYIFPIFLEWNETKCNTDMSSKSAAGYSNFFCDSDGKHLEFLKRLESSIVFLFARTSWNTIHPHIKNSRLSLISLYALLNEKSSSHFKTSPSTKPVAQRSLFLS